MPNLSSAHSPRVDSYVAATSESALNRTTNPIHALLEASNTFLQAGALDAVAPIEVLLAEPLGKEAQPRLMQLEAHEARVTCLTTLNVSPQQLTESVIQAMKGKVTDLLVVRGNCQVNQEFVEALAHMELPRHVLRVGTGMDNIDTDVLDRAGITYSNTPEVNTESAAELAIGLLFAAARGITVANDRIKKGNWSRTYLTGLELRGKTLGVVGYGRIGQTVAKTAAAIGMKVNVLAPRHKAHKPEDSISSVEFLNLEALTQTADFLTIHIPLTRETRNLIGQRELDNLSGRNAVLVNTARGGIVDEQVLLDKLNEGSIYAAGIDVFEQEDGPKGCVSDQLAKHPRVVAAPHIGGQTLEASYKMADQVVLKAKQMYVERLSATKTNQDRLNQTGFSVKQTSSTH